MPVAISTETKRPDRLFVEAEVQDVSVFTAHNVPTHDFGFRATAFILIIDSTDPAHYVEWSWDGKLVDGKIFHIDHHIAFDCADSHGRIWLRGPAGVSVKYRLYAWIKQR